jgi:hypothetical protein
MFARVNPLQSKCKSEKRKRDKERFRALHDVMDPLEKAQDLRNLESEREEVGKRRSGPKRWIPELGVRRKISMKRRGRILEPIHREKVWDWKAFE